MRGLAFRTAIASFALGVISSTVNGESGPNAPTAKYEADWESLDKRPLPAWFNEAKFGIFIVWGPYSVPAWRDRGYAEWYGSQMYRKGSATQKFHIRNYGDDFKYEQFAPMFRNE